MKSIIVTTIKHHTPKDKDKCFSYQKGQVLASTEPEVYLTVAFPFINRKSIPAAAQGKRSNTVC